MRRRVEKKMPDGPEGIYKVLDALRGRIYELKTIEQDLKEAGCVKGTLHLKTGTRKMFHLSPSRDGVRLNTYIGVDPVKQANWTARVERCRVLEQVIDARCKAEFEENRITIDLMHLSTRAVDSAMIALRAIGKASASGLLDTSRKEQLKIPYQGADEGKSKVATGGNR